MPAVAGPRVSFSVFSVEGLVTLFLPKRLPKTEARLFFFSVGVVAASSSFFSSFSSFFSAAAMAAAGAGDC